jgi:hypothetical protein
MDLHPQILEKDGKPAFVILPYEEFVGLTDALEDALDVIALREAAAEQGSKPGRSLDDIKKKYGIADSAPPRG